ncbi:MAG: LysM peptidoglycan-binding domain-containing protein [Hydrogenobacter thermophilus]|uniref:LysM peptidoglycan-binding domain-containing protein n=1 Tax=Hydrogenobacter thermophilus TaxID=940 RepID=UPI001C74F758|nr:LysM peptidoglycan-binding domain-containing protein [Hydrogenobacter thermophilus]QWK20538.1 MAG: LysM peptidoglycan-binding domain-containing protein [Hydrogenobacter thermophilus]
MKREVLALGISVLLGFAYAKECEYYQIQKGDTLTSIAKKKGVSVEDILSHNKHLDPNRVKAGEKICIPTGYVKSVRAKNKEYDYYVVERGGRLEHVAKRLGLPVKELEELNPKYKGAWLEKGTKVKVPKGVLKAEQTKATAPRAKQDYDYYVMQKGGKLEHVAKRLGVPLKELEALNPEYKGKFLSKGTKVKVPKGEEKEEKKVAEESYDFYTVERGAKLEHISKKLGIPLKTLEKLNPEYKGVWLKKGTRVKVPKGTAKSEEIPGEKTKVSYVKHRVRRGETVSSIAKKYGVSVKEVMRVNHLKSKKLYAGMVLKIPVPAVAKEEKTPKLSEKNTASIPEERQAPPTEIKVSKGSIPMPVDGKVVKSTRGVDIITNCGEAVRSVDDGKVIYSGDDLQAYGNMVIIEHGDFISLYAYNSKNMVKRGETVSKGQQIATVGTKNNSGECMLHFELRTKDGVPLDPTEYLRNAQ